MDAADRNGQGVAKGLAEAVRLYRLAADQGLAYGQYNLGSTKLQEEMRLLEEEKQQVEAAVHALQATGPSASGDSWTHAEAQVLHAGLAYLTLDPARLFMDPTSPPLGSGSSADTRRGTYRFHAQADPADIALKLFRGGHAVSGVARDQILQEIYIGARLHHANLIQLFGVVEVPGHGMVLAMELASGGSLRDVLSDRQGHRVIAWPLRLRWLAEIAQGMTKLHSVLPRAIIHRDLKSANVCLAVPNPSLPPPRSATSGWPKPQRPCGRMGRAEGLRVRCHGRPPKPSRANILPRATCTASPWSASKLSLDLCRLRVSVSRQLSTTKLQLLADAF
jgi:hypothetical protein